MTHYMAKIVCLASHLAATPPSRQPRIVLEQLPYKSDQELTPCISTYFYCDIQALPSLACNVNVHVSIDGLGRTLRKPLVLLYVRGLR